MSAFTVDVSDLAKIEARYEGVSRALKDKALISATRDASRKVNTLLRRGIKETLSVKAAKVKDRTRTNLDLAGENLEIRFAASRRKMIAKYFGARQTKKGVTLKLFGKRYTVKRAFLPTGDSQAAKNGIFLRREGKRRLPIRAMIGPEAGYAQNRRTETGQLPADVETIVRDTLFKRYESKLGAILARKFG